MPSFQITLTLLVYCSEAPQIERTHRLRQADMTTHKSEVDPTTRTKGGGHWNYHPALPLGYVPVFVWPLEIFGAIKFLFSREYFLSFAVSFGGLATFTWYYLQPALERCEVWEAGWIAQMLARNFILTFIVAGGLHLYFTFSRSRVHIEKGPIVFVLAQSGVGQHVLYPGKWGHSMDRL